MHVATRTLDPVAFTVLRHRLDEIIAEAYHTMGRVSGNPVVYEAGDHQEAIATPEGDLAVFGAGILHWTMSLRAGFKHVISEYMQNPGIDEDDQFLFNDSYIGSIHASDVQVLAPVFHDGAILAWVGSASHHSDTGGVDPGGHHVSAKNVYQEGFQTPGIKIVRRGVVQRDVERTFANMVREPELGLLDIRGKIASNNTMKQRISELVEKHGAPTVTGLFADLISYSEGRVAAKLEQIPDGRWTTSNYVEGIDDPFLKVQVTAIKSGSRLTFDFSGTGPQTTASENVGPVGAMSSAMAPFIFSLAHDIPWNDGVFRRVDFVLPEGTLVNPRRPAALSSNIPAGTNIVLQTATHHVLANMLLASETLASEASATSTGGFNAPVLAGERENGSYFASLIMDVLAGGGGARRVSDGANTSSNEWSVKAMIANVETTEQLYPFLYLWRRESPDSAGAGRYRGGVGIEGAVTGWHVGSMVDVNVGTGHAARLTLGVGGGYPAARTPAGIVRDADVRGDFAKGRMPQTVEALGGTYEMILPKGVSLVNPHDVLCYTFGSGGGGFGDPIDRVENAVLLDIQGGYVSRTLAHEVYGVVLREDDERVDWEATKLRREEILAQRLERASVDLPVIGRFAGLGRPCERCGAQLTIASFDTSVTYGERDDIGRPDAMPFLLRHHCCANCGALVDVRLALAA